MATEEVKTQTQEEQEKQPKKYGACPDCQAVNPTDAVRCSQCGFPILFNADQERINRLKADEAKAREEEEKKKREAEKKRKGYGLGWL